MNKENNRNGAGLRRSAIAERIRLREEWSALKEIDSPSINVLTKKQINAKVTKNLAPIKEVLKAPASVPAGRLNRHSNTRSQTDALRGVVALVEVGSESRALPLRAALAALGATVMPAWSPLITHLVWAQGGCRSTRARGRALACSLVSPLWVEACAASSSRLPSSAFPAAKRPSDLPSPPTLRQMLKKAEAENILLVSLKNSDKEKFPRLRISSDTEQDTSPDTSLNTSKDTSKDTSHDTSKDVSKDTTKETTTDIESRVNTAPRRALPKTSASVSPRPVTKSRRKLFTHKEAEMAKSSDDEDENSQRRPNIPKPTKPGQTMKKPVPTCDRKELARAERMAKRFLAAYTGTTQKVMTNSHPTPRIVLTGMIRTERREVTAAILLLKGRIQKCVNKRTTHVVMGTFEQAGDNDMNAITGITNLSQEQLSRVVHRSDVQKARTLSALCGAARGCRVLQARWILDSALHKKWLHHSGYEVPHLKKIAQKARVERTALTKLRSDYAYDVFCGMRVFVTNSADQRDAAIQLLNLCGAVVQNGGIQNGEIQNGGMQHGQGLTQLERLLGKRTQALTQRTQHALVTQNGEIRYGVIQTSSDYDIKIGVENGEVSSKWVFDSVAAARMRTTRRYVNKDVSSQASLVVPEMTNYFVDC